MNPTLFYKLMYLRRFLIFLAAIMSFTGFLVYVGHKPNPVNLSKLHGAAISLEIIAVIILVITGCFLPETPTIIESDVQENYVSVVM